MSEDRTARGGERVVVTGMGAICAAGRTPEAIWDALAAGRSAAAPVRQWNDPDSPAPMVAEVTAVDDRTLVEDRKLHKLIRRTDMFGLYASARAVEASDLLPFRDGLDAAAATLFNDRTGIFAGSGGGAYQNQYEFFPLITAAQGEMEAFGRQLGETVNPMWLLRNLPNNVLCHVGIRYGFKGTNACITNHCVSGILAAAEAAAALSTGEADRAIAVGHDAPIEAETVLHYHRLGLLATDALRPFDAARTGIFLGEGAAALVLERAEAAAGRGAAVLGELLGSGCTSDAAGLMALRPDGESLAQAIEAALADAGLRPADVGMIVAHGNGTRQSDASEAAAIRRVFGSSIPPVTGFKWAFGHLIAASGILDLALALLALRRRVVPGVATLRSLDPAFGPLPVCPTPQIPRSEVGLVLCRGFGGLNVAVLVRA